MSTLRYRVDLGEFRRAAFALGRVNDQIPRENDRIVRTSTMRGVAKAKAKALTIPARGPKHRGTRKRVSRGVGYRRTPLGYRITTSMPPGEELLPWGFEHQWAHPVYGGPSWVIQHSHYPWFTEPIADEYDFLLREFTSNLRRAAQSVDRMV